MYSAICITCIDTHFYGVWCLFPDCKRHVTKMFSFLFFKGLTGTLCLSGITWQAMKSISEKTTQFNPSSKLFNHLITFTLSNNGSVSRARCRIRRCQSVIPWFSPSFRVLSDISRCIYNNEPMSACLCITKLFHCHILICVEPSRRIWAPFHTKVPMENPCLGHVE